MEETLQTISSQVRSVWRHRWAAISTVWVVCILGWIVVFSIPDQYRATASVYIDVSSRLDKVIGGVTIERDIESQLSRVRQEMLGRPVLEVVARETQLDRRTKTPEELSALLTSLQEEIVIQDVRRTEPRGNQQTDSIFSITYHDIDRMVAVSVVQQLLDTFVDDVMESGHSDSAEAQKFLIERIAEYSSMLKEREQAMADFKRQYIGLLPGESGGYFNRLQTYMYELDTLESDLRTAISRRDALREQLVSQNPDLPSGLLLPNSQAGSVPQNPIDIQIAQIEESLYELRRRFTDRHPDVLSAQAQLEGLYQRRRGELERISAATGNEFEGSALSSNPVYQSIQMALNEIKVEIAAKERQIDEHKRKIANLREKVDVIPEIEARVVELTRDYDQVEEMHDALVGRLEQERLGTAAERGDLTFRVIEPPVAGTKPASPMRLQLLFGTLLAGLAAGGFVAFAAGQSNPVFSDSRELREYSGLPVLGAATIVWARAHKSKRRVDFVLFGAASVLLLAVFVSVVVLMDAGTTAVQSLLQEL